MPGRRTIDARTLEHGLLQPRTRERRMRDRINHPTSMFQLVAVLCRHQRAINRPLSGPSYGIGRSTSNGLKGPENTLSCISFRPSSEAFLGVPALVSAGTGLRAAHALLPVSNMGLQPREVSAIGDHGIP